MLFLQRKPCSTAIAFERKAGPKVTAGKRVPLQKIIASFYFIFDE